MSGWILPVFTTTLKKKFAYKVDFWVFYFGSLIANMAVSWYLWAAIYLESGKAVIRGYTLQQMVLYYLIAFLVERIVQTVDHGDVANDIYEGALNKYLIYPLDYFAIKLTANLAEASFDVFRLILILALWVAVFGLPSDTHIGARSVFMGLSLAFIANVASYFISSCVEAVAFWMDNVWSLRVMQKFIASITGGLFAPLALFPEWAQTICSYLPFQYLYYFPIRAFLGEIGWTEWVQAMGTTILWGALGYAVLLRIWRRGLLQYSGIGI